MEALSPSFMTAPLPNCFSICASAVASASFLASGSVFWAVSYTHLDVYKRQAGDSAVYRTAHLPCGRGEPSAAAGALGQGGAGSRAEDVYKRQPFAENN